jgi:hypothetical protein
MLTAKTTLLLANDSLCIKKGLHSTARLDDSLDREADLRRKAGRAEFDPLRTNRGRHWTTFFILLRLLTPALSL